MKISDYELDFDPIIDEINDKKYQVVGLQVPEGLKNFSIDIVEFFKKKANCEVIVIADSCFGACDVGNYELKNLDVEMIVQIGHTPILNLDDILIPIHFVNALYSKDISKVIKESLSYLDGKKVGIVTTAQHLHSINNVKKILIENDFIPILSAGDSRIYSEGQILGCNFSAGTMIMHEVDCYLFIGSGNFHPIGLFLSVDKPVVAVDPYMNEIKKQELVEFKDKILKQRISVIANLKDANVFGILLGIKKGQQRLELSYKIKKMINSFDKKAYLIAMDNFSSYPLENFRDIDCFVSTSCPRIAIDDIHIYKKSIITPIELEILLGKRDWDDYKFDQI